MFGKKTNKITGTFKTNRITGHVSKPIWQKDKNVKSIGFTHNENDRAEKVKLKHNIDPKDTRDCYAKTKVENQKSNTYRDNPKYKDYRIHPEDRPTIDKIIASDKAKTNKKRK